MLMMLDETDGEAMEALNLLDARRRYVQAIQGLRLEDGLDRALRHELEQAIARIDKKLSAIGGRVPSVES